MNGKVVKTSNKIKTIAKYFISIQAASSKKWNKATEMGTKQILFILSD